MGTDADGADGGGLIGRLRERANYIEEQGYRMTAGEFREAAELLDEVRQFVELLDSTWDWNASARIRDALVSLKAKLEGG